MRIFGKISQRFERIFAEILREIFVTVSRECLGDLLVKHMGNPEKRIYEGNFRRILKEKLINS